MTMFLVMRKVTLVIAMINSVLPTEIGSSCDWDGDGQVKCNLKHSSIELVDKQKVAGASALTLKCSDMEETFFLSTLTLSISMTSTSSLHDMTVSGCPVQFDSRNSFRKPALVIDQNSLDNIGHKLKLLDLSFTGLRNLPMRWLCNTMPNLNSFNISNNSVKRIEDGMSSGCIMEKMEHLDLSFNQIRLLQSKDLLFAPNLKSLNLAGNSLSVLSDRVFSHLSSLVVLDLSDNILSSLQDNIFENMQDLQKLFLQNNSLSHISTPVMSNLHNLLLLNISFNQLSGHIINKDTFKSQVKLVALDLSHNIIKDIPSDVYAMMNQMQILNLQHNQLSEIRSEHFSHLPNLHVLMLSFNQIQTLHPKALVNLQSLDSLSLNHNNLPEIPDELFQDCPNIQDLTLHHNLLTSVPKSLSKLSNLQTLDLGENQIGNLTIESLPNSLYGLRLAGNDLKHIPLDIFTKLSNLNVLNLSHNKIKTIEEDALRNLKNLRALRLDNNRLQDMNGIVSSLKNLRWLNVSTNELEWFDFAFVPRSLEWLDIHNNLIKKLGNYYELRDGYNLTSIDASYNSIEELDSNMFLTSLTHIYLNNNNINNISAGTFSGLASLTRVELHANKLVSMNKTAIAAENTEAAPEFLLGDNPWQCDCNLEWLKSVNSILSDRSHARVADIARVTCSVASEVDSTVPILSVRSDQFLCPYEAHCHPHCFCCNFYACDCRMQCPDGCSCSHDTSWSINIIQCSSRGHLDVPPLIPMDATTVYLDGNNMSQLDNPGFVGRKMISSLFLNSSRIKKMTNLTLEGLTNVKILHLEQNLIEELTGQEFLGLSQLEELYLQQNKISRIAKDTFSELTSLSLLRLDGNLLTSFPVLELINNQNIFSVYLANNPWSCDCDYLSQFRSYLEVSARTVTDRSSISCREDTPAGITSVSIDIVRCQDTEATVTQLSAKGNVNYTPIMVAVLLGILLIILAYLVFFTFRHSIKACLCGNKVSRRKEPGDNTKLFDIFISYSLDDRHFVEESLSPALEQGDSSYRLCLHQRDFPASTPLSDSVSVAVESSTVSIIILSRSYLHYQWPLVSSVLITKPGEVIFVQLTEVSSEDLAPHPELCRLISHSQLVKWGDVECWSRLKYFLPEPVYLTFQRNVTLRSGTLQGSKTYEPISAPPETDAWTYFKEDSLDTNTTDISESNSEAQRPTSTSYLDHTYYSIDNNHLYHTLDPAHAQFLNIDTFLTKDLYLRRQGVELAGQECLGFSSFTGPRPSYKNRNHPPDNIVKDASGPPLFSILTRVKGEWRGEQGGKEGQEGAHSLE